ncbi:LOW QUALITY PROTEIN: mechanosensitive ion channel protein 10-like [Durio zibethinus]|uniref:Mechanosensitive ion channel protein n=1 Tax=Durio zibethinus TaxID=66656 RepID=A0A6P5XWJ6_DURZI|nr:LOW QUALITY PROTEIN: mechanosensitive ion channel protein 10-like [Durio zibethinus]
MEAKDMSEKRSTAGGEVVIHVSGEENPKGPKGSSPKEAEALATKLNDQDSPNKASTEPGAVTAGLAKSVPASSPSSETTNFGPSVNKPPKIPSSGNEPPFCRKWSLAKPKSRFGEQSYLLESDQMEENILANQEQVGVNSPYRHSFNKASPNNKSTRSIRTDSAVSKTLSMASTGPSGDEIEDIIKKVKLHKEKLKGVKPKVVIECVVFLLLLGCLIASLTVDKLQDTHIWHLTIWKWCVLVMVIFCGMLVTRWFMHLVVFLIELNFLLQKKVLYFVHGLKKSVQVFIWLSLVLVTWVILFLDFKRSKATTKILDYVTWTLVSILIGAFLWLLKTLLLKILASNFHMNKFFERIQESIFHHYVLKTLSGRPLMEINGIPKAPAHLTVSNAKKGKAKTKKLIDMGKVHKLKREKVSSWHMKVLIDAITNSGLSTISYTLEESAYDEGGEQTDKEITSEEEAHYAAYKIFSNVVRNDGDHNHNYIDEDDLSRFMIKEEVDLVFPLFEGSSTKKISRKSFTNWVIKVYNDQKTLAHALSDTKTAVKQLNKLVTVVLIIVTVIIWLLLTEIATTKVLVLISSQLVVAVFMFGNTCKNIFEAIIFVFVMHPFDVGDRCVVDGVQLLVEEMNILTTVFLKLDNEKVYYPNSVLATKPISNYYRSPDMGDTIEFSIDFMTPAITIGRLKEEIKKHLEANNTLWHPNHLVVVKEIENVNKLKMALYCNHTMNFQDFREKNRRKSELVIELKRIFEELGIRYNFLPQHVNLNRVNQDRPDATYVTA